MGPLQLRFNELLRERHPMMQRGLTEARAIAPELVDTYFEQCLGWIVQAYGSQGLENVAEGYASFTLEVNRSQQAYECRGAYEFSTFAEADARVYQQAGYMRDYYWGVFAILFCWSHYVELMEFFLNSFVRRLGSGRLIEIAPGHGAWGLLAIKPNKNLRLEGWDISPTSLEMAPLMAAAAGLAERASYCLGDATKLSHGEADYDAAICSFMLEHLEDPGGFLTGLAPALKPGGLAYISLALTASQTDHIYEFKRESEGILLAEAAGFELLETRVARPARMMPGANRVPRVQAMLLRKA
jgi:2-polyprenyl-3-methyl-5-hydroxy-6-metoxy-1,4-benzoquinol methylase